MPTRQQIPSRFVITDLNTVTTTWLDQIVLSGAVANNLNQPAVIDVSIRPNTRQANGIFPGDGFPRVAQSNRLIYHFMLERKTPVWKIRSAGIIMSPQDQADADVPTSHLVAYDPWQYLAGVPAFIDEVGNLPGPNGFLFPATEIGIIAATLLKNAILSFAAAGDTFGCFIDAGPSYGGTTYWAGGGGVIETTPVVDFTVQQGQSVKDCWDQLVALNDPSGGPDGCDIVLIPIYNPATSGTPQPGKTHNLAIYNLAGTFLPGAPMGWGTFNRASTTADRQHDGTPGAMLNQAYFAPGQGTPIDTGVYPFDNPVSVAAFGPYSQQQWFPDQISALAVEAMAHQALSLQKQGKRTFTLDPDPVRAAPPFQSYNLGDRIPVLTSRELRVASTGEQRIQGIPLTIDANGFTRVNQLLTTPDWRGDSGS